MPSPLRVALATIAFAFIFSANVSTANAQQKSLTPDQKQVVDTVNTIFSAASTEDIAKLDSVTAPDFYIFANGMRFNGDALILGCQVGQLSNLARLVVGTGVW